MAIALDKIPEFNAMPVYGELPQVFRTVNQTYSCTVSLYICLSTKLAQTMILLGDTVKPDVKMVWRSH